MKPVDPTDDKGFSLRRWSQRKAAARAAPRTDARADERSRAEASAAGPAVADIPRASAPAAGAASVPATPLEQRAPSSPGDDFSQTVPHAGTGPARSPAGDARARGLPAPASPLPAIDSLGIDSDFTAFMRPGVDESLKRGALKKLFSDPRFNVMDGLDVYIDDYSKPDPIDPAIVRTLAHARYIFNPPATRVTAQGHVEDVPEEELRAGARDPDSQAAAEPLAAGAGIPAALPNVQSPADAAPAIARPQLDCVPAIAQPQDDAKAGTKAKPDTA